MKIASFTSNIPTMGSLSIAHIKFYGLLEKSFGSPAA